MKPLRTRMTLFSNDESVFNFKTDFDTNCLEMQVDSATVVLYFESLEKMVKFCDQHNFSFDDNDSRSNDEHEKQSEKVFDQAGF